MRKPVLLWRNTMKNAAGAWESETAQGSFGRLWRVFMNARVAIAAVLAMLQQALQALGTPLNDWTLSVCIVYLCTTLTRTICGASCAHRLRTGQPSMGGIGRA